MSFVELALRKMQQAGAKAPTPAVRSKAGGPLASTDTRVLHRTQADAAEIPPPVLFAAPSARREGAKLVRIDRQALRAAGLLPPEHQERALADQYRHIKRPLIANAIGHNGGQRLERGQIIMMASAMPGEGKTFTSINLALSMALEKDISVLLIDADAPKPHVGRVLGVEREPGLLDLLRDESMDPESVILPTDVPNLSIMSGGSSSETATELLASQRMGQVARQLAERDPMRIAIIDSPPLLLTSESRALAHSVGQVVLVVRANMTPQQAVMDAIAYIGEGAPISLVLNQSRESVTPGYYYGHEASESGEK